MPPATELCYQCIVRVLYTGSTAALTSQTRSSTLKYDCLSLQDMRQSKGLKQPEANYHLLYMCVCGVEGGGGYDLFRNVSP